MAGLAGLVVLFVVCAGVLFRFSAFVFIANRSSLSRKRSSKSVNGRSDNFGMSEVSDKMKRSLSNLLFIYNSSYKITIQASIINLVAI